MYLTRLSLTNFRNFTRLDLEVPRGVIVLVGDNAQGKTSLLEAVSFLATLTSFHTHLDRHLINFLATRQELAVGRLIAEYRRGETAHRQEVRLILGSNGASSQRLRREVLLDGVKRSVIEAIGHFEAVLFAPQMSRILEGGPEERRRYLNLTLAQAVPHYAHWLSTYAKALEQRNALLKLLQERGGEMGQLDFWDETLAQHGAEIIASRIEAVQEIEGIAAPIHARLTRGAETLRLHYLPSYDPLPQPPDQLSMPLQTSVRREGIGREAIRTGFLQQLRRSRNEEIARGITLYGPHRDELCFLANGVDLGEYGSRGQIRTALLSLKLAELEWIKARSGHWPVLLLDEVMAELDPQRRADLLSYVGHVEQVFLTATDLKSFAPEFLTSATIWKIQAGVVMTTSPA